MPARRNQPPFPVVLFRTEEPGGLEVGPRSPSSILVAVRQRRRLCQFRFFEGARLGEPACTGHLSRPTLKDELSEGVGDPVIRDAGRQAHRIYEEADRLPAAVDADLNRRHPGGIDLAVIRSGQPVVRDCRRSAHPHVKRVRRVHRQRDRRRFVGAQYKLPLRHGTCRVDDAKRDGDRREPIVDSVKSDSLVRRQIKGRWSERQFQDRRLSRLPGHEQRVRALGLAPFHTLDPGTRGANLRHLRILLERVEDLGLRSFSRQRSEAKEQTRATHPPHLHGYYLSRTGTSAAMQPRKPDR